MAGVLACRLRGVVGQSDLVVMVFFFSSRRRHTRFDCDWSSDVCSSDLPRGSVFPRREALTARGFVGWRCIGCSLAQERSEEHTSELQSQSNLVCRLLLEKKKKNNASAFGPPHYSCRLLPYFDTPYAMSP